MATNGNLNHQDQHLVADAYPAPSSTVESATAPSSSTNNLPKDEVGWYFVEQYYTTLSKSPEKLHLFYGKRSQYVYGREAEVTNVSVGRQAIQERIKALDIQDCKVRISNVDSQGSGENIVIQVIGETSNKAAEPKKFVQTFILAQQPSGYFVLNDIFRFIDEDVDEEQDEATEEQALDAETSAQEKEPKPVQDAVEMPHVKSVSHEKEPVQLDAKVVDQKLEEVSVDAKDTATESGEDASVTAEAVPAPKAETPSVAVPDPEKTVQEIADEEVKKPETPQDPSPTPVVPSRAPPPAAAPAEAEKPVSLPAKPMTWANRAAAAAGAQRPAVPAVPKAATPAVATQARPTAPATAATPTAAPAAAAQQAPAQAIESSPAAKDANGWQTAETKRQSRPQSISGATAEKEGTMAYIKYVTEKIQTEDLRVALAKFGELAYFDINRQKNCAFVEFVTQTGYNAAVAANPHTVNGEQITVEQRRPKANAYGGSNYNGSRGGVSGRGGRGGSGGYEPSRSNSQGGSRGGFTGPTRAGGRGGAPRGRGPSGGNA